MLPKNDKDRIELLNRNPQFFIEEMVTNGLGYRDNMPSSDLRAINARLNKLGERYNTDDDLYIHLILLEQLTLESPAEFDFFENLHYRSIMGQF